MKELIEEEQFKVHCSIPHVDWLVYGQIYTVIEVWESPAHDVTVKMYRLKEVPGAMLWSDWRFGRVP